MQPSERSPSRISRLWLDALPRPVVALIAVLTAALCALAYWEATGAIRDLLFPYIKDISLERHLYLRRIAAANVSLPVGLFGVALLAYPLVRAFGHKAAVVVLLTFLPLLVIRLKEFVFHPSRAITELAMWWEFFSIFVPLLVGVVLLTRKYQREA